MPRHMWICRFVLQEHEKHGDRGGGTAQLTGSAEPSNFGPDPVFVLKILLNI